MKRQIIIPAVCTVLIAHITQAQERLGIANSNYAGTTGMPLNPSSMVDSKAWLDINIVGADAFLWNNYLFMSKEDFRFIRDVSNPQNMPSPRFRTNGKEKHGVINLRVDGPSFTLSQGKNAFGFHTAGRTFVSFEDIMEPSAQFISNGLSYDPQEGISYQQPSMGAYATAWAEVGLSYGRIVYQKGKDMVTAGITAKYLMGIGHYSVYLDDLNHTVNNDQEWTISNFNGQYAMTDPGFANGHGFGVDIGATYKRMLEDVTNYAPHTPQSDCGTINYKYKIGVSLLDLGGIRFNKNSLMRQYNSASAVIQDYPNSGINSIADADAFLVNQLGTDGNTVTTSNRYSTQLPSAVSVQFDYNIGKNFYANATWVQGFRFGKKKSGIRRSIIGITPRYEIKWFEAALPLSLYDYRHPQLGLALRFYNLTIGSDNILPFFFPVNVFSGNIYASLKITLFKNPACRTKKGRSGSKSGSNKAPWKRGSAVDCPAFN